MPRQAQRNREQGLGLVELMIGLVLGLLVIIASTQIFLSAQRSAALRQAVGFNQESGASATTVLARGIREAGFRSCHSQSAGDVNVISKNPDDTVEALFGDGPALKGVDPDSIDTGGLEPDADSDALEIHQLRDIGVDVVANMNNNNANIKVSHNPLGWSNGDPILITDCSAGDLFAVTNNPREKTDRDAPGNVTLTHSRGTNTTNRLSQAYDTDAMILAPEKRVYFVARSERVLDERGEPMDSLFVKVNSGPPREVVSGVERLVLRYGVANDEGEVTGYQARSAVGGWDEVVSVRYALVIASPQHAAERGDGRSPLPLWGESHPVAGDARLRTLFAGAAAIRNASRGE